MRGAYRVLAILIAVGVVVQAAAIAYALSGLGKWVDEGGVLDKAAMESDDLSFQGIGGFIVHGMNGMMLIPLLALLLLIVSFFAKVPQGVMWAGIVVALVALQVSLGIFGRGVPWAIALHGINALVLFGVAVMAAMRARTPVGTGTPVASQPTGV
jgi:hypothetical protein